MPQALDLSWLKQNGMEILFPSPSQILKTIQVQELSAEARTPQSWSGLLIQILERLSTSQGAVGSNSGNLLPNPPLNSDPARTVFRSFSSFRFLGFVRRLVAGGAG